MDDDSDCDIFAGVKAYCNSNQLDEIFETIQSEKEKEEVVDLDQQRIAEIEKLCEYKSTRRKGKGRGKASEAGENEATLTSESVSQESQPKSRTRGRGRGRGRGRRGAKTQTEQNDTEPSPPQQNQTSTAAAEPPQRVGRVTRTARRSQVPVGPVVAVVNLGCDSDSDTPLVPIFSEQPRRGRARRDFLARKAADLAANSVIEVNSSPSESESAEADKTSAVERLDESFDTLNPEVSVKMWWNGKIERFTLRKYQQFAEIIKILANREQTSEENIFLSTDERIIKPSDSPDSINYKIHQFISGKVIKNFIIPNYESATSTRKRKDPNLLELKVQSNAWKKPLIMSMRKEETFKVLYVKCAEELKRPYDSIKLLVDGDYIQFEDTPNDLELEGQEIIDCQLV